MSEFFGLDVGSSMIKVAQIRGGSVVCAAMTENPLNRIGVDVLPAERQKLLEVTKRLISDAGVKTKNVVIGVPEVLVYSKVMSFPVISSAELASAIKWQADQEVPLPADQVELSWAVIEKPLRRMGNEMMKVLVVATPKKLAESVLDFVDGLGLKPMRAENELVSLSRLFGRGKGKTSTTMAVDFGANAVRMVVLNEGKVAMTHSYNVGGLALTRAIAQEFSLGIIQAEQYKRAYGVDRSQAEGKIYKGMEPVFNSILTEMDKVLGGFAQSHPDNVVERVVLAGGSVYLKGLLALFSERMRQKVEIGDPFEGLKVHPSLASSALSYACVMGLAMEDSE